MLPTAQLLREAVYSFSYYSVVFWIPGLGSLSKSNTAIFMELTFVCRGTKANQINIRAC
jgi:hypothetical protein